MPVIPAMDEDLLNEILCLILIPQPSPGDSEHVFPVLLKDLFEGGGIPLFYGSPNIFI
jgi:hypothetical protein